VDHADQDERQERQARGQPLRVDPARVMTIRTSVKSGKLAGNRCESIARS